MKRYPLPLTVLAGALLALAPADAAAQRRGGPAHGGGHSAVVVRPAYGPYSLRGISGSIAVQIGGR